MDLILMDELKQSAGGAGPVAGMTLTVLLVFVPVHECTHPQTSLL